MLHSRVLNRLFRVGTITLEDLQEAASTPGLSPEQALVRAHKITVNDLLQTLTRIHGVPAVSLATEPIDPQCVDAIPVEVAVGLGVLPLRREDGKLVVAMRNPSDLATEEYLRTLTHSDIKRVAVLSYELEERLRALAARPPRVHCAAATYRRTA